MPRQIDCTRPRIAVTARNAGCLVSISFLPAERYSPSAPNDSAARAFWAGVRLFLTPNQVNDSRAAAIVVRRRCDGAGWACACGGASASADMETPWNGAIEFEV